MIRVFIADDFIGAGIAVSIVLDHAGDHSQPPERRIMRVAEKGHIDFVPVDPMTATDGVTAPTFRLCDDMARALLEELTRHYHGADDSRALRRDYDAERGRVDKLTDALIGVAQYSLARPAQGASASTA